MPSKIEWCDETINPLGWGCYGPGGSPENPQPCSYCYARRFAARNTRGCDLCRQFIPHWHPEQLDKPHHWRRPRRIFVQSMGDLLHDYTPEFHIELVMYMVKALPRHTFIFLTKNPKRLKDYNPWPRNAWIGTTVTHQADADERLPWLLQVDAPVRFVSMEPLLGPVDLRHIKNIRYSRYLDALSGYYDNSPYECDIGSAVNWGIIGGMTGPGAVIPKPEWVMALTDQYQTAGVPVFLKNNLGFSDQPQEFPGA